MKMATLYKIIIALVSILLFLSTSVIQCDECYTNSDLQEMKEHVLKKDREAIDDLMWYYSSREDQYNLFLIICFVHNNKIYKLNSGQLFDNNELRLDKCPENPMQKIKEKNRFRDYYDYLYCLIFG